MPTTCWRSRRGCRQHRVRLEHRAAEPGDRRAGARPGRSLHLESCRTISPTCCARSARHRGRSATISTCCPSAPAIMAPTISTSWSAPTTLPRTIWTSATTRRSLRYFQQNRDIAVALNQEGNLVQQADAWIVYTQLLAGTQPLDDQTVCVDRTIGHDAQLSRDPVHQDRLSAGRSFCAASDAERSMKLLETGLRDRRNEIRPAASPDICRAAGDRHGKGEDRHIGRGGRFRVAGPRHDRMEQRADRQRRQPRRGRGEPGDGRRDALCLCQVGRDGRGGRAGLCRRRAALADAGGWQARHAAQGDPSHRARRPGNAPPAAEGDAPFLRVSGGRFQRRRF